MECDVHLQKKTLAKVEKAKASDVKRGLDWKKSNGKRSGTQEEINAKLGRRMMGQNWTAEKPPTYRPCLKNGHISIAAGRKALPLVGVQHAWPASGLSLKARVTLFRWPFCE